jgi:hypothetical protein
MNAKQRNKNRDTSANLRYCLAQWNSRNRKMVLPQQPKQKPSNAPTSD